MTETNRTVEDNLREEQDLSIYLEQVEQEEHRLKIFEEEITDSQEKGLFHIRNLIDRVEDSNRLNFYHEIFNQMIYNRQMIQDSIDEEYSHFKDEKKKTQDRLDDLYYERQRLYDEEEKKKTEGKLTDGKNGFRWFR